MVRLSGRHTAEVPVFAVLNTVNNDEWINEFRYENKAYLLDCWPTGSWQETGLWEMTLQTTNYLTTGVQPIKQN